MANRSDVCNVTTPPPFSGYTWWVGRSHTRGRVRHQTQFSVKAANSSTLKAISHGTVTKTLIGFQSHIFSVTRRSSNSQKSWSKTPHNDTMFDRHTVLLPSDYTMPSALLLALSRWNHRGVVTRLAIYFYVTEQMTRAYIKEGPNAHVALRRLGQTRRSDERTWGNM